MELFRALGALLETPGPGHGRLAAALDLGALPSAADHTDLFELQLQPYASIYLGAEGLLGGEARDRIAGFWRALGLTPPPEPDHLAVMLALYAELCEQGPGGPGAGGPNADGERWLRARRTFLWEHLLSWLAPYLARVRDLAPPFYRRWADLLEEALTGEAGRLGRQELLPLHLRSAPVIADPRQESAKSFLDSLLSPARSGLILVRDDLRRAAGELGLGLRIGERRYVLKALLSQEPRATLGWLAGEAAGWVERHRGGEDLLGPVARFWAERASASAALLGELSRAAPD
jgi:TorA maturation chaperone TorD